MFALMIILNCAKDRTTLQVYEATNAAETIISYVECPIFNISILSKIVLGFLKSHLTNEQFKYLELDEEETTYFVMLFRDALKSPDLRAEGNSLEEILQFLVNFTQPYLSYSDEQLVESTKSKSNTKPSQFRLNSMQRKHCSSNNIQMAVKLGILSPIEELLQKSDLSPLVLENCLQFVWNILHLNSTTKDLSSSFQECLGNSISACSKGSAADSLLFCIQWLLGNVDKSCKLTALLGCY